MPGFLKTETKNIFAHKSIALILAGIALANIVSIFTWETPFCFRLHAFQLLVFLLAFRFGATAGAMGGAFGSVYNAVAMGNPYIVLGNMILGFTAGLLAKRLFPVLAALMAFAVQLPYLWFTDVLLMHMPVAAVARISAVLFIEDLILAVVAWAVLAKPWLPKALISS